MAKPPTMKQRLLGQEPALRLLPERAWARMVSAQNRGAGRLYERMAALGVYQELSGRGDLTGFTVLFDRKLLPCFAEGVVRRRYDIHVEELATGYEVKSYRTGCTAFVREQVRKDRWLLEQGVVKEVWWILFQGGTARLLQALTEAGILYIDVQGPADAFTNIPAVMERRGAKG